MFKCPGKQIKTLAKIILWVCVIVGILIGIFLALVIEGVPLQSIQENPDRVQNEHLAAALVALICGCIWTLVGWISSMLLYAFGSVADDVETIKGFMLEMYIKQQPGSADSEPTGKPTWMQK